MDLDAVPSFLGLRLGDTDLSDLEVGEDQPRYARLIGSHSSWKEGVASGDVTLEGGVMAELEDARDITGRIYRWRRCLQPAVDLDVWPAQFHPCPIQAEARQIRAPAGREQQQVRLMLDTVSDQGDPDAAARDALDGGPGS